ncbi:MAG TPA: hypothetical protein VGE69_14110, partial [Pseudomonadales bacterium]
MATEETQNNSAPEQFLANADMTIVTAQDAESHAAKLLAAQIQDWWYQERSDQAENRLEQDTDTAFYDGDQWSEEEIEILEARGQAPTVVNLCKPTIDWLIGTERRTRIDHRIEPTQKDGDEDAKMKTRLVKYVRDANHAAFKQSQAFQHTLKAGLGWLEYGVRGDLTDEPIYINHESWRNIWHDSKATDPMFINDGRYIFRRKVVDLDIAIAMFPGHKDRLIGASSHLYEGSFDVLNADVQLYYKPSRLSAAVHGAIGDRFNRRRVVPLVECWYRKPRPAKFFKNSDKYSRATEYSRDNPEHVADVKEGGASLYDKIVMQMYVCMFVDPANHNFGPLLCNARSPYRHNRFPFVPIWAYRRDHDGMPYGPIRQQRDPQKDFNKRHSKAIFILSSKGITYEEGAIDPEKVDEILEEIGRPNFAIEHRKGFEFKIHHDNDIADAHIAIANMDERYIRQVSGTTGEQLGLETNARSGVAIERRQSEGGVLTLELFDNLRYSLQVGGEILLSLIEQYMDLPKQFAVTGDNGLEFHEINMPAEDGSQLLNDITARQARFVVSEQDWNATIRLSMFNELMEMLKNMPGEVSLQLLDVVVDMSSIPERKQIVRRIRQINGHPNPDDVDEQQLKDDEQARRAAREEAATLQKRQATAEVEK